MIKPRRLAILNADDMTKDVKELGLITSGSLVEGLQMKLGSERSVEEVKAGKFVVVHFSGPN